MINKWSTDQQMKYDQSWSTNEVLLWKNLINHRNISCELHAGTSAFTFWAAGSCRAQVTLPDRFHLVAQASQVPFIQVQVSFALQSWHGDSKNQALGEWHMVNPIQFGGLTIGFRSVEKPQIWLDTWMTSCGSPCLSEASCCSWPVVFGPLPW